MTPFNISSIRGLRRGQNSDTQVDPHARTHHILFVCTGNIARSASAELLARKMSSDSGWTFSSAGIGAVVGAQVAPHLDEHLLERGADISKHQARQILDTHIRESDLVLVMELEHLDWIIREWPQCRSKIHLLKQMARLRHQAGRRSDPVSFMTLTDDAPSKKDNIADPYGRGKQAADKAFEEIEDALEVIIPWLGKV